MAWSTGAEALVAAKELGFALVAQYSAGVLKQSIGGSLTVILLIGIRHDCDQNGEQNGAGQNDKGHKEHKKGARRGADVGIIGGEVELQAEDWIGVFKARGRRR